MPHPTALSAPNPQRRPAFCGSILSPALGIAVGALLCLASASAWAGAPWLCSLADDATRLVCVVDQEATSEPGAPAGTPSSPTSGTQSDAKALSAASGSGATLTTTSRVVNGTAFPLDTARVYTVELFAPATERDWVEQLARATICYRSPGCEVIVVGMDDPAGAAAPARSSTAVARLTRPGS